MKRLNALMARPPEADVGCLVLSELTTGATVSSKVLLPEVPLSYDLRDIGVSLQTEMFSARRNIELHSNFVAGEKFKPS
jgi:hypothetical protein